MLKKYIIGGCDCWLTESTARKILAERDFYEVRARWEATRDPRDWDLYSDLYKSKYGVRPR